jgi:hypothetical protein
MLQPWLGNAVQVAPLVQAAPAVGQVATQVGPPAEVKQRLPARQYSVALQVSPTAAPGRQAAPPELSATQVSSGRQPAETALQVVSWHLLRQVPTLASPRAVPAPAQISVEGQGQDPPR